MFILAYRFRLGSSDPFPHDAYPIDTAWTGPAKAPEIGRQMAADGPRPLSLCVAQGRPE